MNISSAMMNMFDAQLPYAYSFGSKSQDIMEKFRKGIIAGICNVFHRHINLMDDESPRNSRFSPTGERYTFFGFYDFNAMYCHAMRLLMPLTPGIRWEKIGNWFKKSLMIEANSISFPHMQWLYYMQEIEGYDSKGKFVQMEHGYHRGEKRFMGHLPDGYMYKDGRHYFYEFLGMN